MNKVSIYKEAIYKQAARAWKTHFSEGVRDRLINSGILNHEKELKGLDHGTEEIVRKLGGKIKEYNPDSKAVAEELFENSKNNGYTNKMRKLHNVSDEKYKEMIARGHKAGGGYITDFNGGTIHKGIGHKMLGLDKADEDYMGGIMLRHEADELRSYHRLAKNKKHSVDFDGTRHPTTGFRSHVTPSVLLSESANITTAPKEVADKNKMFRSLSSESGLLQNNGFNYGKSGIFNKKKSRELENISTKYTKPTMQEMANK